MTTLTRRLRRVDDSILAVGAITVIAVLAHLILVPLLGFYKEDWYLIWRGSTTGGSSIIPLFGADRPMAGYVYAVLYPLLGDSPIGWHLTAFAFRLAGASLVYAMIRMVWPKTRAGAYAVAILFIVYPGYLQQYHAVNKAFWLTSLTAALGSLTLTVASFRASNVGLRWLYAVFALILAAFYPTIIEFYIGFEAVRLALIWVMLQQDGIGWKQSLTRTAALYSPYLIPAVAFLFWRFFIFESTRQTTDIGGLLDKYLAYPVPLIARLVTESVKDFIETVFLAWAVPFNNRLYPEEMEDLLIGGAIGVIATVLAAWFYWLLQGREKNPSESPSQYRTWLWLGAFAAFMTLVPLIAAGRDVNFDRVARADHYTIQASFGAAVMLVGLLHLFLQPKTRTVVFSLLVGVSVYTHYQQNAIHRDFWQIEKDLWWQLSWRAPDIEEGTLLFVKLPPSFAFQEGYEAWAPANFIYAPGTDHLEISGEVLDVYSVQTIIRGVPRFKTHRTIPVQRNFGKSLILSIASPQYCLETLDPSYPFLALDEDPISHLVAPYSRPELIQASGDRVSPRPDIFGQEPEHTFCYYYQKAQLARQIGDWMEVARLADEVIGNGYGAYNRANWMVFFEGYVHTGRLEDARGVMREQIASTEVRDHLCARLLAMAEIPENYQYDQIQNMICK